MAHRIAVAGATGQVGREIIKTLAEREFPAADVSALASGRAVGGSISFGERNLSVGAVERHDWASTDLVFLAPGTTGPVTLARKAVAAGCVVIDVTGMSDPDAPVVVPEVNPGALAANPRIVASPVAGAILLSLVLHPLQALGGLVRIVATSLQPVSGAGKDAMDELFSQTRGVFVNDTATPEQFTKPIAFNLIPHVGGFGEGGLTDEEEAIAEDTSRLLGGVAVAATCVRVPVFIGQSLSVHASFDRPIDEAEAREAIRGAPGLTLLDRRDDGGYVTPLETVGEDPVFVSRLRVDPTGPNGIALWCAGDNLRKGGALNAVQIAEELARRGALRG
ncbi:aspartate-semialdehyde dehydrogenase [Roseomonas sp. SSH11]|uniref:Aspartate-semialdehyde dehydrogenase n=1 Tax=Pararoseomonas baculiformis TaxID=2820812 RepID=A0ABS4AJ58_9PROT|nr:aspartate-semialdehyde dehydrogenase [Pararoseomonas baculiformis]MBP0447050.1 aspartate-semialdehyde dehydrogenase [Pararoseomonas baculiformis]